MCPPGGRVCSLFSFQPYLVPAYLSRSSLSVYVYLFIYLFFNLETIKAEIFVAEAIKQPLGDAVRYTSTLCIRS